MTLYTYRAVIDRIIDADTVVVHIDLGFTVWMHDQHIRFAHINAPELKTEAGKAARTYLFSLLGDLPVDVILQTLKDRQDNYGRYLGVFITAAGINLNEALVQAGHAVRYDGKGKAS